MTSHQIQHGAVVAVEIAVAPTCGLLLLVLSLVRAIARKFLAA